MKITAAWLLLCIALFAVTASAQTTSFKYQGSLNTSGSPSNGNFDFEFALFDALSAGTQVGTTQTATNVAVANGSFTVTLDFGSAFPGAARFLEVRVRTAGAGAYTTLAPRQQVASVPYAIRSLSAETATSAINATNAATATNATNATTATNALSLGGVAANQYVLTGDPRLSDARTPSAGSTNYIQNQNGAPQAPANFNISGMGTVGGNFYAALAPGSFAGIGGPAWTAYKLTVAGLNSGLRVATSTAGGTVASFGGFGAFQIDAPGIAGGRFTILENGNAGLGTSSPGARLSVSGGGFGANLFVTDGNPTATTFDLGNTSVGGRTWRFQSMGGGDPTRVGGLELWNVGGSFALGVEPNGNVGIGTNSPNSKLEVNGTIHSSSGGIKFPDGSTQTAAADNTSYTTIQGSEVTITPNMSVRQLNLPPGTYLLLFDMRTRNFNLIANRRVYCWFPSSPLQGTSATTDMPGISMSSISMHYVVTLATQSIVSVNCTVSVPDGPTATDVYGSSIRLTAIKLAGNVIVQ